MTESGMDVDDSLTRLCDGFDNAVLSNLPDDALDGAELNARRMFVFDGESKVSEEVQKLETERVPAEASIRATSSSHQ